MVHRIHCCFIGFHSILLMLLIGVQAEEDEDRFVRFRSIKDMETWRYMQIQAKQDFAFRTRVMTHTKTCAEEILCQRAFMKNSDKKRLLDMMNAHRNVMADKTCHKKHVLELLWLWKAEINATIDSLSCSIGPVQTDFLLDGDVLAPKYYSSLGSYHHARGLKLGNERERLTCYPNMYVLNLKKPTYEEFFIKLRKEFDQSENVDHCITNDVEYGDCLYVGCSITFTKSSFKPNTSNAYFVCYYCSRKLLYPNKSKEELRTSLTEFCPEDTKIGSEYNNLCQDPGVQDSWVDEEITQQFECKKLARLANGSGDEFSFKLLIILLSLHIFVS